MKKYNEDGRECESCMWYISCFYLDAGQIKGKKGFCKGWYYVNKEQVKDILKYWENKDLDFIEGDKVYSFQFGNGVITAINPKNYKKCLRAEFKDKFYCHYTVNGKYHNSDVIRSLYHGHDLNIQVNEKKPIRKVDKWVFLYTDDTGQEVNVSRYFDTEFDCQTGIYRAIYTLDFTVLSKPIKIQVLLKGN